MEVIYGIFGFLLGTIYGGFGVWYLLRFRGKTPHEEKSREEKLN